jgi:hypothetical protein
MIHINVLAAVAPNGSVGSSKRLGMGGNLASEERTSWQLTARHVRGASRSSPGSRLAGLAARGSHPGSPPSRLLPGWVSTWRRWTGNDLEADQVLSRSHS